MPRINPSLIPRSNWDYGFSDYVVSLSGVFGRPCDPGDAFRRIFGREPLFTTSGRASLYAILKSLRLPPGSEIGVPLFCCSVVFDAIREAALTPRFIDVDPADCNLSAVDLERKKRTLSAVVAVHMFGVPADMDALREAAGPAIPLIEDCAHSLFSTYKGKYTGTLSTAAFFSFRSGKYISAGEGSAVFTANPELFEAVKRTIESFPSPTTRDEILHATATLVKSKLYQKPWYGLVGYPVGMLLDRKFNLTAKSGIRLGKMSRSDAALIAARIRTFRARIEKQGGHAAYLMSRLALRHGSLPVPQGDRQGNAYQFPIRFRTRVHRDAVADYLFRRGIDCAKYLDEIVEYAAAAYGYKGDCPDAERCSKTTLLIPHYYLLSGRSLEHLMRTLAEADHSLG